MGNVKTVLWFWAAGISTAPDHPLETIFPGQANTNRAICPHQTGVYFVISVPYHVILL